MSAVHEWWVAMYGHPPSTQSERKEFAVCLRAWEKHPDPKSHCDCGETHRLWSGEHIACANPRCDKWGKTHDGQEILDLHPTDATDILRALHEGVKRNT